MKDDFIETFSYYWQAAFFDMVFLPMRKSFEENLIR